MATSIAKNLSMVDAFRNKKQLRGVRADTAKAYGCPKSAIHIRKVEGYLPWAVFVDSKKCKLAPRQYAGLTQAQLGSERHLLEGVGPKRGWCGHSVTWYRDRFGVSAVLIDKRGRSTNAIRYKHLPAHAIQRRDELRMVNDACSVKRRR